MPKNAPMRLANKSRANNVRFSPCWTTHGTNCEYGSSKPTIQSARYNVLGFMAEILAEREYYAEWKITSPRRH